MRKIHVNLTATAVDLLNYIDTVCFRKMRIKLDVKGDRFKVRFSHVTSQSHEGDQVWHTLSHFCKSSNTWNVSKVGDKDNCIFSANVPITDILTFTGAEVLKDFVLIIHEPDGNTAGDFLRAVDMSIVYTESKKVIEYRQDW